jgi:hypothetical protein
MARAVLLLARRLTFFGQKIEMATTTTMNTLSELTIEEVDALCGPPLVYKTIYGYVVICTYCADRAIPHPDGQTKWKNRQKNCMDGERANDTVHYNVMQLEMPWEGGFKPNQPGRMVKWKCLYAGCVEYNRQCCRDKWQGPYCYRHQN